MGIGGIMYQEETLFSTHTIRQLRWMVWQVIFEYLSIVLIIAAFLCLFLPLREPVWYICRCLGLYTCAIALMSLAHHDV